MSEGCGNAPSDSQWGFARHLSEEEAAEFRLKDSGEREQFPSGMVRDIRTGKGRYDLISPYAERRLAKIMEKGCEKYGERNWELGADPQRFYDSLRRHLAQWQMSLHDEDHLGQAFWNLHCIVHFDEIGRDSLDDRP